MVELVKRPEKQKCWLMWSEVSGHPWLRSLTYFLTTLSVAFISVPFTLFSILYSVIFLELKSHKAPGEKSVNAAEQQAKRNSNALKMSIAIVLGQLCSVLDTTQYFCDLDFLWGKTDMKLYN